MRQYLIAHDIGTSGDKASLFHVDGRLIKSVTKPYETRYPDAVRAEQNAEDWWTAVCSSTKELLEGYDKREIAAVCFSGQMQGLLCVDKNGMPLAPFMMYNDLRAREETEQLKEKVSPWELYTTTGHPMNSSYTLEKLMWVKAKMPDVYKKTYKILSAKDYIIYKLTGQFLMDVSNGSATNAMDIREMNWSGKLIEGAGVDGEMFPELRDATYVTGEVSASMSLECGLAAGTPVVLGGGDGQCASVGAGSVAEGLTYISAGSSSWISTASKIPVFDKDMTITNFAHIVPGYVCPSGTMQTAGSALNWVKNTICRYETAEAKQSGGSPYDSMNEQIAASVPGAGGLLFLPYLMGERAPRWNPNAKGAFIGLKLSNTRGDILRSVIEGIGMNLDIILNTLRHDIPIREMGIIGGMAKGNIVCQIFADIMGMNINKMKNMDEVGAMGAAVAGGVGVGVYQDFTAIEKFSGIAAVHEPDGKAHEKYEQIKPLFDKAYYSLKELFDQMTGVGA